MTDLEIKKGAYVLIETRKASDDAGYYFCEGTILHVSSLSVLIKIRRYYTDTKWYSPSEKEDLERVRRCAMRDKYVYDSSENVNRNMPEEPYHRVVRNIPFFDIVAFYPKVKPDAKEDEDQSA